MLKGMTRRVIVVKSPDKKLFEEAVFFLKDDADKGVSGDQIVAEARAVADAFLKGGASRGYEPWLRAALWAAGGSLLASLVWALFVFLV